LPATPRCAGAWAEPSLSAEHQLDRFDELYHELLALPAGEPAGGAAGVRAAARRERVVQLTGELDELRSRTEALRVQLWRRQVIEEVQAFVAGTLPAGADVLIISRGDEEIVDLPGHRGGHFPQTGEGTYAGFHPADSSEAIAHLEELRRDGAQFLVVPATASWWLEHYRAFAEHLERRHARIAESEDHYVVFALDAPAEALAA
jgi:hypothetical protein